MFQIIRFILTCNIYRTIQTIFYIIDCILKKSYDNNAQHRIKWVYKFSCKINSLSRL